MFGIVLLRYLLVTHLKLLNCSASFVFLEYIRLCRFQNLMHFLEIVTNQFFTPCVMERSDCFHSYSSNITIVYVLSLFVLLQFQERLLVYFRTVGVNVASKQTTKWKSYKSSKWILCTLRQMVTRVPLEVIRIWKSLQIQISSFFILNE
jgi:hypothetical protein